MGVGLLAFGLATERPMGSRFFLYPHTCILSMSLHCPAYYFLVTVRWSGFPVPIITATFRARKGGGAVLTHQKNNIIM